MQKKHLTLEEQLAGRQDPTQFGHLLDELGIRLIVAHTPQAKGRIERAWGTLQDRLVTEMRLAGVSSLDEANRFLEDFIPRYNARFATTPADPGSAFLPVPQNFAWNDVFSFRHRRQVANDNTIAFHGRALAIPPQSSRRNYARATVEVREHLGGEWSVSYEGQCLVRFTAPDELPKAVLRPPSALPSRSHRVPAIRSRRSEDDR
ncbi:MAG: integrase core domain-containing protein [Bacillota bacterium]